MSLNYNEINKDKVRRLGKKDDGKTKPIIVTLTTLGIIINIISWQL